MIPYDRSIVPPAPFLEVSIQHPVTGQQETLLAQLDTSADISGIPRRIIHERRLVPARSIPVAGYDGVCIRLSTDIVYLEWLTR